MGGLNVLLFKIVLGWCCHRRTGKTALGEPGCDERREEVK